MHLQRILAILKKNKIIAKILSSSVFHQLRRYATTGLITTTTEWVLFWFFREKVFSKYLIGFGIAKRLFDADEYTYRYLISNALACGIEFCLNFTLNRIYSFKSKGPILKELMKYGILFVTNLFVISGIMYLLSDIFALSPYISKFLAGLVTVSWNFWFYKKIVYN